MSNIQAKQAEFMIAGEQKVNTLTETLKNHKTDPQAILYMNLFNEESTELRQAFQSFLDADQPDIKLAAIADIADGVADAIVTLMGLCNSVGIPFHDVYEEVHRSNMLKCIKQDDGTYRILKRADGKIIKPFEWEKPQIMNILRYRLINGD